MSAAKHTPGPWTYQENSDAYTHIVRGPTNSLICQLAQSTHVEIEANARLIAAAPELLEALIKADQLFRDIGFIAEADRVRPGSLGSEIRAAIAKATGGAA